MFKRSAAVFLAVFALSSLAEARQLYWTGAAYAETIAQCQALASNNGDSGVRTSCMNDYGIQPEVCYAAPIVSVTNKSITPWSNGFTCEVRVDIYVP